MFNVAIIDIRQITKYIISITIVGILIIILGTISDKIVTSTELSPKSSYLAIDFLDTNIAIARYMNEDNEDIIQNSSFINTILETELGEIKLANKHGIIGESVVIGNDMVGGGTPGDPSQINTEIPSTITTEIISDKNMEAGYTDSYKNVAIKNSAGCVLTEEMLSVDATIPNKKDILIFHTHTCESYTPTEAYGYNPTGNYRTTDLNYSVARIGTELTNQLGARGYNVMHDTTYHDYPAYSGSYGRSLETVEGILKTANPSIVIDLHRDAVGSGSTYGPTVKINDEIVAQLMFVIGTNVGGLQHDNWIENLRFAIKVEAKANEMYPGLFRPILLSSSRYNQHLSSNACIIEVGATANTMEQCLGSMKYLASVISEVVK
ncbi:MAG: stage II sporulation protein P [Lachnospiraceae bacterium]|jgi:stage II sporulation protein P|nr:stage II sporulation protein P [Lachnospiraceae bacterium]